MVVNVASENHLQEAAERGPVENMHEQMLMLKRVHFDESAALTSAEKMEGMRISGLPLEEQLFAFNEWAMTLAKEAKTGTQEQIAQSTRNQVELTAKLAESERAREQSDTEVIRLKGELRIDNLTKALSRNATQKELEARLRRIDGAKDKGRRSDEQQTLSILYIDLDHFKEINEVLEHKGGDIALEEFVQLIKSKIRHDDKDLVGRYGGEEFVVVLNGANSEDAYNKAEELREIVENELKKRLLESIPNKAKEIDAIAGTMSVGVATYGTESPSALSYEELIERADQAMFHSKNSGRNKVTLYDPDIISPRDKKMAAENETPIDAV